MQKTRKTINLIVGLCLFLVMSRCSYSFITAGDRMKQTCKEIEVGMTVVQLDVFARRHGLSVPYKESGVIFLSESETFGRWSCRVVLDKGVVQSAEYNFAD